MMCTTSAKYCVPRHQHMLPLSPHVVAIWSSYKPAHIAVGHKALSDDPNIAWARTSLAIAEGQLAAGEAILPEWYTGHRHTSSSAAVLAVF